MTHFWLLELHLGAILQFKNGSFQTIFRMHAASLLEKAITFFLGRAFLAP